MTQTTTTAVLLITGTLVYHGGLAYLFVRAGFGEILEFESRGETMEVLKVTARHITAYRWGIGVTAVGGLLAVLGYAGLAGLLEQTGGSLVAALSLILYLIAGIFLIATFTFYVTMTVWAAQELERDADSASLKLYPPLYDWSEGMLGIWQSLGLLATGGFGLALLQSGTLPAWLGWLLMVWGLLGLALYLKTFDTIPFLPILMPLVVGIVLLLV